MEDPQGNQHILMVRSRAQAGRGSWERSCSNALVESAVVLACSYYTTIAVLQAPLATSGLLAERACGQAGRCSLQGGGRTVLRRKRWAKQLRRCWV